MRTSRVVTGMAIAAALGCGSPLGLVRNVHFAFQLSADPAPGGSLRYEFEVRNRSERTVYLPACGGYVVPEFRVIRPDGSRTGISLLCLAVFSSEPVALGPGDAYRGSGGLARVSGTQYTPLMPIGFDLADGRYQRVRAPSFTVP